MLTSATLTVNQSFRPLSSSKPGFEDARTLLLDSPFDYPQQALLLLPKNLPEPNDFEFNPAMFDYVLPLLEQAQGGVFFLFTSHRSLQMAARYFQDKTNKPLFVQGTDRSQPDAGIISARQAMACCWVPPAFGKGSMCRAPVCLV